MSEPLESYRCTQCGARDLDPEEGDCLRCTFCNARFRRPRSAAPSDDGARGPRVVIQGNARVHIGSKANVVVHGGLAVRDNASLEVEGNLVLLEPGDAARIAGARASKKL